MKLQLEYPVTRTFKWRFLAPLSYTIAGVVVIFLIIINVALTGYETVTLFRSDFNTTESHWFDRFMPYRVPKPGTLCSPHIFNVGDAFTTNYTLFEWKIEAIVKASAGDSGVLYHGAPLDSCDIPAIYITGDLRTWTVDITVVVFCQGAGKFDASMTTSFSVTSLPGKQIPLLGIARSLSTGIGDPRAIVLDTLISSATQDLGSRAWEAFLTSNRTSPVLLSLRANALSACPASMGTSAPCALVPPQFLISSTARVAFDGTLVTNDVDEPDPSQPLVLDDTNKTPVWNLIQLIHAAIRVDLGNPSPNNFLLHPEVLDQTLHASFPATKTTAASNSTLYATWAGRNTLPDLQFYVPMNISGPANIQVVYACRHQMRKATGSLIISVMVATLTMFSGGWAFFLVTAAYFEKQTSEPANYCHGHQYQYEMESRSKFVDHQPYSPVRDSEADMPLATV